MGAKGSKFPHTEEIICPNCPLTPIISIFLNEENGKLTCEFRCPNLHFGYIPFSDLFKNKNIHGQICSMCKKANTELDKELLYCGVCKEFFCVNCRKEHDKEKGSHKVMIEKSRVNYTCLEHNKNFIGYCFSCLVDVCSDCKRHENHVIKTFDEILPSGANKDTYEYYLGHYSSYIDNFKRQVHYNKMLFEKFKERNQIILGFIRYLDAHLQYKKQSNKLNSEVIINFLNIPDFNYEVDNSVYQNSNKFERYCKNHLILKYKPISFICTFSKNKQDFNISRLELAEYHFLDSENPKYFKYSPIGNVIIFFSGQCIYFLSANISDKKIHKIRFESQIFSFNILNKNILCICINDSKNIYLYRLTANPPFYSDEDTQIKIEIPFHETLVQVIGNFNKYIVTRAQNGVINLHKKNKDIYEAVSSCKEMNSNLSQTIYEIKGIWKDYLIIRDNLYLTTRDLTKAKLDEIQHKIVFEAGNNNQDILIYNGNIITFRKKIIFFISIPDLEVISRIELNDDILSINIVNPRTMIVVENNYMEQLEVNTWKRLWWKANFGKNIIFTELMPIGAGKKLFIYNKKDNKFYYTTINEENI